MKKNKILVSLMLVALPQFMMAQDDDMYFVPSKKTVERTSSRSYTPRSTYYSGLDCSVDEYNRRGTAGSYYQVLPTDTTGNDIIDFSGGVGVYPDSTQDFNLTRQMARYEGYEPMIAYREGYLDGTRDSWHSPWFYSSYYPWYDSYWYWNDPWYYRRYGWYSTWYDPWYYDYYYWNRPYWYGGYYGGYYYGGGGRSYSSSRLARNGNTGTIDLSGRSNGRFTSNSTRIGSVSSTRASAGSRANTNNRVVTGSTSRSSNGNFNRSSTVVGTTNRTTTNNRSTTTTTPTFNRSTSSGGGFSSGGGGGGGSFSRSSGGGGGGSRGGGGFSTSRR